MSSYEYPRDHYATSSDVVELDDTCGGAPPPGLAQSASLAFEQGLPAFRQVLDQLPFPMYAIDAEGHIAYFNPASVAFAGRLPVIGGDKWCVSWKLYSVGGVYIPHDECPMAIALRQGRTVRGVKAVAERPDGTRIAFTPFPTPMRDCRGHLIGAFNMLMVN